MTMKISYKRFITVVSNYAPVDEIKLTDNATGYKYSAFVFDTTMPDELAQFEKYDNVVITSRQYKYAPEIKQAIIAIKQR